MTDLNITVYGAEWCGDCIRTRRFLNQNQVQYQWINIDGDKAGEQLVLKINRGMRSIPTIVFEDGTTLTEPSTKILADKLGLVR